MTTKLIEDVDRYSDLLMSVGQQGKASNVPRPLIPIEAAKDIQRLLDETGETKEQVSARLGLGKPEKIKMYKKRDTTQLSAFLKLLKLSKRSQMVLGYGRGDEDKIAFSVGVEIAKLPEEEDQDIVIQSSLEREQNITKDEAIQIVKLKKESPEKPIEECIEEILKIKAIKEVTNIVCCTLDDKILQIVQTNKDSTLEKILSTLRNNLGGQVYSVKNKNKILIISMDDQAFKKLDHEQKVNNKSFSNYVNSLLENYLK